MLNKSLFGLAAETNRFSRGESVLWRTGSLCSPDRSSSYGVPLSSGNDFAIAPHAFAEATDVAGNFPVSRVCASAESRTAFIDYGAAGNAKFINHQGITFRSRQNFPVSCWGASAASQTMPEAPSATERVAFEPPMSVRTQPGQTEFTANFDNAAASCTVTPLTAVFEMQ